MNTPKLLLTLPRDLDHNLVIAIATNAIADETSGGMAPLATEQAKAKSYATAALVALGLIDEQPCAS